MSMPYMPFFIAEYLADTAHLSAAEHGAYLLLIMNYWQRGKPLPAEDRKLARIARMSDDEWAESRETLSQFFVETELAWTHKRIDAELAIASEKSAKAKASARASVSARKANAQRTLNERSTSAELLGEVREDKKDSEAKASGAGTPPDPAIPEREYFMRGREVLGKGAGGLIGKLLKAKGGNVALARAAIEQASQKQNPTEYVAACCRDGPVARPLSPYQQRKQETMDILDGLKTFSAGSDRSGGENTRLLLGNNS